MTTGIGYLRALIRSEVSGDVTVIPNRTVMPKRMKPWNVKAGDRICDQYGRPLRRGKRH